MPEPLGLFDDFSNPQRSVVLQSADRNVSQQDLLFAAQAVGDCLQAAGLGSGGHVINLCKDRYHFIVGFCAGLIQSCTSLLPANRQPQTIAELIKAYPDSVLLVDECPKDLAGFTCLNLKDISLAVLETTPAAAPVMPMIDADHIAAIVFTSGSTGKPTAISKPWRTFVGTAQLLAKRFITAAGRTSIIATVPSQHMYGLETTVMMALHGGAVVYSGQPFYADDIREVLSQLGGDRMLVTTPVHLAALVSSGLPMPAVKRLISATAPLDQALALQAESYLGCEVSEIFGCSEAGSFATRRTISDQPWAMLDGMRMVRSTTPEHLSGASVLADHLIGEVVLQDQLDIIDSGHFTFVGRSADMLNVAGKRASLSDLSIKLQQIDGVDDAVFFLPESNGVAKKRPAALAVSRRPVRELLQALAQQIDPVFLPRPLKLVAAIPRNELGKTPRHLLLQLINE